MTKFETPDPISITIDILGNTHITASDRTDTVITVAPRDPSKSSDVKAAEQTVVDYSPGRLLVKSPRSWGPVEREPDGGRDPRGANRLGTRRHVADGRLPRRGRARDHQGEDVDGQRPARPDAASCGPRRRSAT